MNSKHQQELEDAIDRELSEFPAQHPLTIKIEGIALDGSYCGNAANCRQEFCAGVEETLIILDDYMMNRTQY